MKRIYLAHQLSAPTREGIEANRRSAAKWAAWISTTFKVAVSADWITLTGELEETPENREWGLLCDLAHIERCDEIWTVGSCMSAGMTLEAQHAGAVGVPWYDLTGLPMHEQLLRDALAEDGWEP